MLLCAQASIRLEQSQHLPCRSSSRAVSLSRYASASHAQPLKERSREAPVLTRLPARSASTTTLANGSTIASPLNGYQYVKVVTVLPEDDIDFEPWTNCAAWTNRTTELYASPAYTKRAAQDKDLLDLISSSGLVGERTVSMANFYNVWDYVRRLSLAKSARAALRLRALTPSSPSLASLAPRR